MDGRQASYTQSRSQSVKSLSEQLLIHTLCCFSIQRMRKSKMHLAPNPKIRCAMVRKAPGSGTSLESALESLTGVFVLGRVTLRTAQRYIADLRLFNHTPPLSLPQHIHTLCASAAKVRESKLLGCPFCHFLPLGVQESHLTLLSYHISIPCYRFLNPAAFLQLIHSRLLTSKMVLQEKHHSFCPAHWTAPAWAEM